MLAYKFLRPGAVGPFSGFAWPADRWVAAREAPAACRTGVHGCRLADLPWWLAEELWVAEFAAPVREADRKVVASRARLVERVGAWDDDASREFAAACARRAQHVAVAALERAGASAAAERLGALEAPRDVRRAARELDVPEAARISVLMAGDGASRAITGPTATAAYIAAHAARHAGGAAAMEAERRRQVDWLTQRLGLAGSTVEPRGQT
jgi:hypothetical protein